MFRPLFLNIWQKAPQVVTFNVDRSNRHRGINPSFAFRVISIDEKHLLSRFQAQFDLDPTFPDAHLNLESL